MRRANPGSKSTALATSTWINLFLSIVHSAFMGQEFRYRGRSYDLEPTISKPYDFLRSYQNPQTEYQRLLSDLEHPFKEAARAQIYRKKTGWIARGIEQHKIRVVSLRNHPHIVPVISSPDRPSVGIDSSTTKNQTVFVFVFLPDYDLGPAYYDLHLGLSRTSEFKWNYLTQLERTKVFQSIGEAIPILCNGILVIKTDVFLGLKGRRLDVFRNLIEGCFSGYETMYGEQRQALRKWFFEHCNRVEIHCDADFSPLSPLQISKVLVRSLASGKEATPLFADLRSHESKSIQTTDIIAGALGRQLIVDRNLPEPLAFLFFDMRKMKSQPSKSVKAYFFKS